MFGKLDYKDCSILENPVTDFTTLKDIEVPISNMDAIVYKLGGNIEYINSNNNIYSDFTVVKTSKSFIIRKNILQSKELDNFCTARVLGILLLNMGYLINDDL